MLIRQKRNEFDKKILERQAKMEAQLSIRLLEKYRILFCLKLRISRIPAGREETLLTFNQKTTFIARTWNLKTKQSALR